MNLSDSSYVLPASLQPHYCRYVEDSLTCFTHCQMLTNPKNSCHLKGRHPNIRLTVEYPKLKTLRFLDCDVTINEDNLQKQGKSHFGQNQISQNSERYHDGA